MYLDSDALLLNYKNPGIHFIFRKIQPRKVTKKNDLNEKNLEHYLFTIFQKNVNFSQNIQPMVEAQFFEKCIR